MDGSFTIHKGLVRRMKQGDWIIFRLTSDGAGHAAGAVMSIRSDMKKGDDIASLYLPFVKDTGDAVDFLYTYFQLFGEEVTVIRNSGNWESASLDAVFQIVDFSE